MSQGVALADRPERSQNAFCAVFESSLFKDRARRSIASQICTAFSSGMSYSPELTISAYSLMRLSEYIKSHPVASLYHATVVFFQFQTVVLFFVRLSVSLEVRLTDYSRIYQMSRAFSQWRGVFFVVTIIS